VLISIVQCKPFAARRDTIHILTADLLRTMALTVAMPSTIARAASNQSYQPLRIPNLSEASRWGCLLLIRSQT